MSQPFHRLHDQAEEDAIKMSAVAPDAAARERMRTAIEEKINRDPFTKPLSGALTDSEWAAFEAKAATAFGDAPPSYDPPQKRESFAWLKLGIYRIGRSFCCGVAPLLRCLYNLPCCCPTSSFSLLEPHEGFKSMLERRDPKCPPSLRGLWWLADNVAGEGVISFEAGEWSSDRLFELVAGVDWTVDTNTAWGVMLTAYWRRKTSGRHQMHFSPNKKWVHIVTAADNARGSHWIYIPSVGEVIRRGDGTVIATVEQPGQVLMRLSVDDPFDPDSVPIFQYLVLRVAHLDPDGNVVLDPAYEQLRDAIIGLPGRARVLPRARRPPHRTHAVDAVRPLARRRVRAAVDIASCASKNLAASGVAA